MKKIVFLILAATIYLTIVNSAFAADVNVQCSDTSCLIGNSSTLFTSSEKWSPGKSETKSISIQNIGSTTKYVGITPHKNTSTGNLDKKIKLIISQSTNQSVLFSGSLFDFYNQGLIYLDSLTPNQIETYTLSASMDPSANNAYQNQMTSFSLDFGFNSDNNTNPNSSNNSVANPVNNLPSNNTQPNTSSSNSVTERITSVLNNVLGTPKNYDIKNSLSGDDQVLGTSSANLTTNHKNIGPQTLTKSVIHPCTTTFWWLLILLAQIFTTLVLLKISIKSKVINYIIQTLIGGISAILLWHFLCYFWPTIISILFTFVSLALLYKIKILNHEKSTLGL